MLPTLTMFSLAVRDHVMIAHSFRGAVFGPAQRLHGATYVVDVEVRTAELDGDGLVIDIGILSRELSAALEPWRYQNLDEVAELAGRNTTTERLAQVLHAKLATRLRALHADGIVVDIGRASDALRKVLAALNFRNLDDEALFRGRKTTTEFLAFTIFERMAAEIGAGGLGEQAAGLTALRITLHESHVAWAAYEGPLRG